jgi:hypothetical protein
MPTFNPPSKPDGAGRIARRDTVERAFSTASPPTRRLEPAVAGNETFEIEASARRGPRVNADAGRLQKPSKSKYRRAGAERSLQEGLSRPSVDVRRFMPVGVMYDTHHRRLGQ